MSSMGMDKVDDDQALASSTWVKILNWTVRSGFPATVITNSALVVDTSGTYSVTWRGDYNGNASTQQFRVMRNGATQVGSTVNKQVVGNVASIALTAGDTLELQGFTNGFFGVSTQINGGAANTYLYITALSTPWTAEATRSIGWTTAAAMELNAEAPSEPAAINWGIAAETSQNTAVAADDRDIQWDTEADTYLGIHYDAEAAPRVINWNTEADMFLVSKVTSLPSVFSDVDLTVAVHTADGRMVGDFPCRALGSYTWGREATEVSTADLQIHTQSDPELIEELRQWVHWVTLWMGSEAVWTGPLWKLRIGRAVTQLAARDPSIFMWRTRVPLTRTFTDSSPARIADVVWRLMNQLHGIRATPLVLPGVADETFTVAATADSRYLHQFMEELVKVGLQWTVAAGRPVLGQFMPQPVAELQECDFLVEIERVRDGSQTFNDVRVQGQNWAQTAIAPLEGLHLQGLVSLDDMFGASNIQRAAQQYARETARLRDDLVVPASASLHPQAPVAFDDLVPGKVFALYTETASQLMRLDQLTVSGSPETFDVQVTLVPLEPTGDIAELKGGAL